MPATEYADIKERVAVLDELSLEDEQPSIEASVGSVLFDPYSEYDWVDRNAYESRWNEEAAVIAQVDSVLKRGEEFINLVYTYRSVSKALPQAKTNEDPKRDALYEKSFEVLEPEIQKLKKFMYFQRDTVKFFCDQVRKWAAFLALPESKCKDLKDKDKVIWSESMIWYMIRLLDLLSLLDALKNMKACLNNDFSFYKRAFGYIKKTGVSEAETQENHVLYLFLGYQNSITTNLKTEIQQIPSFDDVLLVIANQCASQLENDRYVLPWEKHCLLRVLPFVLFLMDGDAGSPNLNIFKSKKLNLSRYIKIFRKYPVVPLYGDMQITLESMIRRSPHFDEKVWGTTTNDPKMVVEYEITNYIDSARTQHNEYLAKFTNLINEIKAVQKAGTLTAATGHVVTSTILQGFSLLSDLTSRVLQQSAWKYAHPNNDKTLPETLVEYERVVKHNYTLVELSALVEMVSMIKGLSGIMLKAGSLLLPIIRSFVHHETQEFIQNGLRELIYHAAKKKKLPLKAELVALRAMVADWAGGVVPNDPLIAGGKRSKSDPERLNFNPRATPPSPSQLMALRSTLFGLSAFKAWGKKAVFSDKDFASSSEVKLLEDYYNKSFYYSYLLNYTSTITTIADLGDLWYKEFYLEMSKRLQFPIEMSLPWILTDHVVANHVTSLMEYFLFPLDIYNDAANRALRIQSQRFLYDEIEAELNLAFDQLVYKLSDQIYTYFKTQASSIQLDQQLKGQLEQMNPTGRFNVPKSRYDVILKQRHVQLLGRSVDLNTLLGQRFNTYLKQNIEFAVARFEASDLTSIIELELLLDNLRLTHELASKFLSLDDFDSLLAEVNETTSLVSLHGRIQLHVIFELMYDFFPNFTYNLVTQRFVRAPYSFTEDVARESMPKSKLSFLYGTKALSTAFGDLGDLAKKYVGFDHLRSILRVVGRANIPLILAECSESLELKTTNVLAPYVRSLLDGMPPSSKLPLYDYGTIGGVGYFKAKLADIMSYPDLKTEVFYHFKEFGNTIAFINLLDLILAHEGSTKTFVQAAPFLGIRADNYDESLNADAVASAPLYVSAHTVVGALSANGLAQNPYILQDLLVTVWKSDKLYRPSEAPFSPFKQALHKFDFFLDDHRTEWTEAHPESGAVLPVDGSTEFYRLWSALQFVYCLPPEQGDLPPQEMYGDGIIWAGATLIHLLGQRHRFEIFDFSYHIQNMEEAATAPTEDAATKAFLKNVSQTKDFNRVVFNILQTYFPAREAGIISIDPPGADVVDIKPTLLPTRNTASVAGVTFTRGNKDPALSALVAEATPAPASAPAPMTPKPQPQPTTPASAPAVAAKSGPPTRAIPSPSSSAPATPKPQPQPSTPAPPPPKEVIPPPESDLPPPPPPEDDDLPPPPPDLPPPPPPPEDDEPPPPPVVEAPIVVEEPPPPIVESRSAPTTTPAGRAAPVARGAVPARGAPMRGAAPVARGAPLVRGARGSAISTGASGAPSPRVVTHK